jgi:iron complex transport system substrate-binding protein
VSLLPSATEIICALGLRPFLVGRSHECDYPEDVESLPVCTRSRVDSSGTSAEIHASVSSLLEHRSSVYDIEQDLLEDLMPTHVVTQIQCEVCAVSETEVHQTLADWHGVRPDVISLAAMTVDETFQDILRVGKATGRFDEAAHVVTGSRRQIEEITRSAQMLPRRRVIGIEWLDPIMGTGNWMPELIVAAGGVDLCSSPGRHAEWLQWEQIKAAKPDLLVLFPCGYPMEKTRGELPQSPRLSALNVPMLIANGSQYFNRPGPRLVETLEILAEMFHPQQFDFGHRGRAWDLWQS